jgi:cation diffusion facilitator CzcD-associated flavoprotein CzcO
MRPEFASRRNRPNVSVLIVGGGINGIGLLRELAEQGIDVLGEPTEVRGSSTGSPNTSALIWFQRSLRLQPSRAGRYAPR